MEKRNHFNCIAKINQAEGKSDLTTQAKGKGEKYKGKRRQTTNFFKKRKKFCPSFDNVLSQVPSINHLIKKERKKPNK